MAHGTHQACGVETATDCHSLVLSPLADILTRFHQEAHHGVCDTGRYRCPYHLWGQGPELLFIPGLCDDAFSFVLVMSLLKPFFRCISYDLPAGGGDGANLARYRHSDFVADVNALLDHVVARECHLYGASFGSTITLAALGKHPERFPRAIVQGGFARRSLAPAEVVLARFARYWPWSMHRLPGWQAVVTQAHSPPFVGRDPRVWQFFLERFGNPPMSAVARRALLLHQLDLRPLLPTLHQPVLMLCGDGDPLVGKNCEGELLLGLPHVSRAELVHCGHLPQFTHPELVAELTHHFLMPQSC